MLQNQTVEELRAELLDMVEDLRREAVYCLRNYEHYEKLDVPSLVTYYRGRLLQIKSMHNKLVLTLGLRLSQWLKYDSAEIREVKDIIKDIEALSKEEVKDE